MRVLVPISSSHSSISANKSTNQTDNYGPQRTPRGHNIKHSTTLGRASKNSNAGHASNNSGLTSSSSNSNRYSGMKKESSITSKWQQQAKDRKVPWKQQIKQKKIATEMQQPEKNKSSNLKESNTMKPKIPINSQKLQDKVASTKSITSRWQQRKLSTQKPKTAVWQQNKASKQQQTAKEEKSGVKVIKQQSSTEEEKPEPQDLATTEATIMEQPEDNKSSNLKESETTKPKIPTILHKPQGKVAPRKPITSRWQQRKLSTQKPKTAVWQQNKASKQQQTAKEEKSGVEVIKQQSSTEEEKPEPPDLAITEATMMEQPEDNKSSNLKERETTKPKIPTSLHKPQDKVAPRKPITSRWQQDKVAPQKPTAANRLENKLLLQKPITARWHDANVLKHQSSTMEEKLVNKVSKQQSSTEQKPNEQRYAVSKVAKSAQPENNNSSNLGKSKHVKPQIPISIQLSQDKEPTTEGWKQNRLSLQKPMSARWQEPYVPKHQGITKGERSCNKVLKQQHMPKEERTEQHENAFSKTAKRAVQEAEMKQLEKEIKIVQKTLNEKLQLEAEIKIIEAQLAKKQQLEQKKKQESYHKQKNEDFNGSNESPVPDGWIAARSQSTGRTYYKDKTTGETTWQRPKEKSNLAIPTDSASMQHENQYQLPDGWIEMQSRSNGRTYYANQITRESSWYRPQAQPVHAQKIHTTSLPLDETSFKTPVLANRRTPPKAYEEQQKNQSTMHDNHTQESQNKNMINIPHQVQLKRRQTEDHHKPEDQMEKYNYDMQQKSKNIYNNDTSSKPHQLHLNNGQHNKHKQDNQQQLNQNQFTKNSKIRLYEIPVKGEHEQNPFIPKASASMQHENQYQLPDGWIEIHSRSFGRTYYANLITGESSWHRPQAQLVYTQKIHATSMPLDEISFKTPVLDNRRTQPKAYEDYDDHTEENQDKITIDTPHQVQLKRRQDEDYLKQEDRMERCNNDKQQNNKNIYNNDTSSRAYQLQLNKNQQHYQHDQQQYYQHDQQQYYQHDQQYYQHDQQQHQHNQQQHQHNQQQQNQIQYNKNMIKNMYEVPIENQQGKYQRKEENQNRRRYTDNNTSSRFYETPFRNEDCSEQKQKDEDMDITKREVDTHDRPKQRPSLRQHQSLLIIPNFPCAGCRNHQGETERGFGEIANDMYYPQCLKCAWCSKRIDSEVLKPTEFQNGVGLTITIFPSMSTSQW